jgi:hypothetical protein
MVICPAQHHDYAETVPVAGDVTDGDTVMLAGRAWQVLHTPGHSAGLVCLYEPRSHVLLSDDHLLRDISSNPVAEPPPPGRTRRYQSLVEYLGQLRRVAALDVSVAWPGHGDPIHNVSELVRQRVEFHARRAGRILELFDGHELTAFQIMRSLFPVLDPIGFFLAISEVMGHLELLESEGRVRSIGATVSLCGEIDGRSDPLACRLSETAPYPGQLCFAACLDLALLMRVYLLFTVLEPIEATGCDRPDSQHIGLGHAFLTMTSLIMAARVYLTAPLFAVSG